MEEVPRATRVPLQCDVGFRRHGDARYRIELIDFSPQGCCIMPPVKVEPGERVVLRFADIEAIHGRVAWTEEWKVGVKFDRPFHPAVFDSVVERLNAAQDAAASAPSRSGPGRPRLP
ncbi:MAG: PilZ domain-containing protein [Sphingomonas bacterium]|nr:PilZ domain-containing protein [Sphingomonas bacterium]